MNQSAFFETIYFLNLKRFVQSVQAFHLIFVLSIPCLLLSDGQLTLFKKITNYNTKEKRPGWQRSSLLVCLRSSHLHSRARTASGPDPGWPVAPRGRQFEIPQDIIIELWLCFPTYSPHYSRSARMGTTVMLPHGYSAPPASNNHIPLEWMRRCSESPLTQREHSVS